MSAKRRPELTAEDLQPLVQKLSQAEQVRLAYYALRISREIEAASAGRHADVNPHGLPDMTLFHQRLGVATYPGNFISDMRSEDDR